MVITEQPVNGSVTIHSDGTITYAPNNGFGGIDSFVYSVCDFASIPTCDTAIVIIAVVKNIPPVAVNDIVSAENGTTNIWEVTLNDSDIENELNKSSVKIKKDSNHGFAKVDPLTGLISYIPDNCYFGIDSLTYVVYDSFGNVSNEATIYITITINPTLDSDLDGLPDFIEDLNNNGTHCDDDTDKDGIPNYIDNDDDGDGLLTIIEDWNHNGNPADDDTDLDGIPNYLDTDDDNDTILTITEDPNHNGNYLDDNTDNDDLINLLDSDDDGDGIPTALETGDLNGNNVPDYLEYTQIDAVNDKDSTGVDIPVDIDVLKNDIDVFGDENIGITTQPTNGSVSINQITGVITYYPNVDFAGIDSFTYSICNIYNQCDHAIVTLNVDEIIRPPQIFTPNGNGQNDLYVIKNIEKYSNAHLAVFNRWGNTVYNSQGYKNDWDGYSNVSLVIGKQPLPVGTYFYILTYGAHRSLTGFIYLKR